MVKNQKVRAGIKVIAPLLLLGACTLMFELQTITLNPGELSTNEFEIRWRTPFTPSNVERFAIDKLGDAALGLCPQGYEKVSDRVEITPKKVFVWHIRCLD